MIIIFCFFLHYLFPLNSRFKNIECINDRNKLPIPDIYYYS